MFFDFVRGGQVLNNRIKEAKEVIRVTIKYSLIFTLIFIAIKLKIDLDFNEVRNAVYYSLAQHNMNINKPEKTIGIDTKTLKDFGFKINNQNENQTYNKPKNTDSKNNIIESINQPKIGIKSKDIVNNSRFKTNKELVFASLQKNFVLFFAFYIVSFFMVLIGFTLKGYLMNKDKFLRGAKIVSLKDLNKIVKRYNRKNRKKYER